MNKSELQSKKIADLREIAKSVGITNADELKKPEIIEQLSIGIDGSESESTTQEEDDRPKRKRKRVIVS